MAFTFIEIDECIMSLNATNSGQDRTHSKPHVTQLIRGLGTALKIKPFVKREGPSPLELAGNNYSEIGFIFETMLEQAWRERLGLRVGEIECEGIIGSPDGIGTSPYGPCVEEYKCTWASSTKYPHEEWRYMMQVKAYCYMLGLDQVLFRVLYINGDYKPPMPKYKTYLYQFDQEEIDTAWFMLKNYAYSEGLLAK
jgi:hypothetical protein